MNLRVNLLDVTKVGRMVHAELGTMTIPALVTVPNVEILEVGEDWETSTGIFTFTEDDLVSAVACLDDPAVRTPIIKLGHVDPRFDGQPSIGRLSNLHLSNNGQTLVGDYEGVPGWLAGIMASAYPRRSIEGFYDVETRTGNKWPFVLTGIALLGTAYPAINTLEDIQAMWGTTIPTLVPADETLEVLASKDTTQGTHMVAFKEADMRWKKKNDEALVAASGPAIRAAVAVEDIRRAFYDTIGAEPGNYWWWIRAVLVDPMQLIVDDDEGSLYRIDYSISDDVVIFAEPQTVKIEYVDVAASTVLASDGTPRPAKYLTGWAETPVEAKRPERTPVAQPPVVSATVPENEEEHDMQLSDEAIRKLGLDPATATEETVNAAILAQITGSGEPDPETPPAPDAPTPPTPEAPAPEAPTPTPEPETAPVGVPEGMVLVDAKAWATVQETTTAMKARLEDEAKARKTNSIEAAVRAGKIEKSRMEFWSTKWDADPEGTAQTLASLQSVLPVTEIGHGGGGDDIDPAVTQGYPEGWKPAVAAASRPMNGRIKVAHD